MPFFESGEVRIRYQVSGNGPPLLVIPGGGLRSTIAQLQALAFDPVAEFGSEYRCIVMDIRNAPEGGSEGPLEPDRPWDSHADDQIALLDHLGVDRFLAMGFCIGGPFIGTLLRRVPGRVAAAVVAQPSGHDPAIPRHFIEGNERKWGPALRARRPEITAEDVRAFLSSMYGRDPDFLYTVTRAFMRACPTPLLVLPDDTKAHPYRVAMDLAELAPNAELSAFPWQDTPEQVAGAVAQVRRFLRAHAPAPQPPDAAPNR